VTEPSHEQKELAVNRSVQLGRVVARMSGVALALGVLGAVAALKAGTAVAASACRLGSGGQVKHVIILQFDNVHPTRDNPNVPSDIQWIPALYHFLKDQGSLLSNDHTVLISHTADGITSTETGLYPRDEGLGVATRSSISSPTAPAPRTTRRLPTGPTPSAQATRTTR
jgi:hypothetical protein